MTTYITIISGNGNPHPKREEWIFVVEEDLIVWGQWNSGMHQENWMDSVNEGKNWSEVKSMFIRSRYEILEETC